MDSFFNETAAAGAKDIEYIREIRYNRAGKRGREMKKKITAVLLVFMMAMMLLPVQPMAASSVVQYDAEKAVKYADDHWDDGKGLCAEYVALCLKKGGIDVMQSGYARVATLYDRLKAKDYVTQYSLTYSGNYTSSDKVKPGDPIFYYCNTCKKALHVVFCRRIDEDGRIRYNAHNNAAYDKKLYSATGAHCAHNASHKYSIYGLHINGKTETAATPTATPKATAAAAAKTGTVKVESGSKLNVRKSASSTAAKIGTLANGAKVTITGTSGSFYKLEFKNGTGYVSKSYVTVVKAAK